MCIGGLKVGITGGIGVGKTTVCKLFEELGVPVYYSDAEAKRLMVEDMDLVGAIRRIFGDEAYSLEGELNRAWIAGVVFKDKGKLAALNGVVHPAVWRDGLRWSALHSDAPYTLKEAALIFESGGDRYLDKIITVYSPMNVRIERLMARDQSTLSEIESRMKAQISEREKLKRSDFVIYNVEQGELLPQVLAIHKILIRFKVRG